MITGSHVIRFSATERDFLIQKSSKFQAEKMFFVLAAQPLIAVSNLVTSTMANAGSSQPMPYPVAAPPARKMQNPSRSVQMTQPLPETKKQNARQLQQPGNFVKYEQQNLYLGPGECCVAIKERKS
jgi:hypothetical protein